MAFTQALLIRRLGLRSFHLYVVGLLFSLLPATRFFRLKAALLRWAGGQIGRGVRCASSARFALTGPLVIGEDTWIGHEVLIVGGDAPIHIGARCDLAPRVMLASGSHRIDLEGDRVAGKGYSMPITLGDGCWVGAGAIILGGTEIGPHSIVAAGAVVKGRFPSRVLIGGVPARVLRALNDMTEKDSMR
jgi:acetyltransferase-like isoleucine patch superfamily enzyme